MGRGVRGWWRSGERWESANLLLWWAIVQGIRSDGGQALWSVGQALYKGQHVGMLGRWGKWLWLGLRGLPHMPEGQAKLHGHVECSR